MRPPEIQYFNGNSLHRQAQNAACYMMAGLMSRDVEGDATKIMLCMAHE